MEQPHNGQPITVFNDRRGMNHKESSYDLSTVGGFKESYKIPLFPKK